VKEIVHEIADRIGRPELARPRPRGAERVALGSRRTPIEREEVVDSRYDLDDGLGHTIRWWRDQIFERADEFEARHACLRV